MPSYVFLANLTQEGITQVEDTTKRAQRTIEIIEKFGGRPKDIFWTQGAYDVVMTVDAPDDETGAAISLAIARQGFLRITTLRAFTSEEIDRLLTSMG
jgi:uncharacterized protein with GYD domain